MLQSDKVGCTQLTNSNTVSTATSAVDNETGNSREAAIIAARKEIGHPGCPPQTKKEGN